MNELDPDLKRLLKWSRMASPHRPEEVPFGFSGRVLAVGRPAQALTLLQELQQTAWGLACVSLALIICGGVVLVSQPSAPAPAAEISSVLNFVANNLAR